MGFLTDAEAGSIRISKMILHVVGEDAFLPEPVREVEHEQFFVERIRDTGADPVYDFNEASLTKAQIEKIASGVDAFEQAAQHLSKEFSRLHVGSSRDGAFFIFELSTNDPKIKLYSLIKYDYREAIEQADNPEGSLLRRIVHAFIADKKAIQKSAIIRVVDGIAQSAISTTDRVKQAPEIGDYFARFLDVKRTLTDEELSKKAVSVVRDILTDCREILPDLDVPRAFRRAKDILRDRQEITEDAIAEAILVAAGDPDDEEIRTVLKNKTKRKMRSAKLEGLTFRPNRRVFQQPAMRKLRTTEGVTILYPDQANGGSIRREQRPNGGETITIETDKIMEDHVVRDGTR